MSKETIDYICWWIPFRKLRDAVRLVLTHYLNSSNDLSNRCNDLSNRCDDLSNRCDDLSNRCDDLSNRCDDLSREYNEIFKSFFKYKYCSTSLSNRVKKFKITEHKNRDIKSVFIVNTVAKVGGAAKSSYSIANELGKLGYKSYMYTGIHEKLTDEKYIKFLTLVNQKEYDLAESANRNLGYLDFFFESSFEIKKLKEFIQSDILHLNNLHGGFFSIFALPELTALKPTVWTIRDEWAYTGHCGFSLDCEKWLDKNCEDCPSISLYQSLPFDTSSFILKNKKKIYENINATIVGPSKWSVSRIKKSILKDHDIRLVYNGIDNNVYKPYRQNDCRNELNLPQDKKILLFSCQGGTDNPWKGGQYILKVYEALKNNSNLFFISIGGHEEKIINNNYKIVPYVKDETVMAKYYSAADLFIYPSLADTFGRVVAEALSSSLPVITFNTGGIPEIIEHMKTGYVAEQKNINDFIKGIILFLEDEILLRNAKEIGPVVINEKFSNKIMMDNYISIYNEIFELRKRIK